MPEMGESVTEGTVLEWHKQEGDPVEEGETVVEVSTDKVDAEVPAPASGTITKILAQPDEAVKVGQVAGRDDGRRGVAAPATEGDGSRRRQRQARRSPRPTAPTADGPRPVARRVAAAERGRPERASRARAPGGKVTKADVLAAADGNGAARGTPPRRAGGEAKPLRGPAGMLAKAMNESRSIPTATSFRTLAGRRARRQAQGAQRRAQGARDEGLVHPPDRLGDRQGGAASGR